MLVKIVAWVGAILYWIGFSIIVPVSFLVIVLSLFGAVDIRVSARQALAMGQVGKYPKGLKSFQRDVGRWPTPIEGLEVLQFGQGIPGWNGPYVDHYSALDPWGRPYIYRVDQSGQEIISLGADGTLGGQYSNAHVSSRKLNEPMPVEDPRLRIMLAAVLGLIGYPMLPRLFRTASVWFLNARLRKGV